VHTDTGGARWSEAAAAHAVVRAAVRDQDEQGAEDVMRDLPLSARDAAVLGRRRET